MCNIKIAVVDDDKRIPTIIRHYLQSSDSKYDLAFFSSLKEAKEKISDIDILLLDIMFPEDDENGWDMLDFIKKNRLNTYVILSTAIHKDVIKDKIKNCFCVKDVLSKPFSKSQITLAIGKALSSMKDGYNMNFIKRDIEEMKMKVSKITFQNAIFDWAFENSPVIAFYKDKENKILKVNKKFCDVLNIEKTDIEGKSADEISESIIARKYAINDHDVISTKLPKLNIIEPFGVNTNILLRTDKFPVFNEEGSEVCGVLGLSVQISNS
jgi:CheY-like chemotaxis protein